MIKSDIITIHGKKPGPTLAIFAGVHGNETAGVIALQQLLPQLSITKGTLHIAFANPPAIKANVRMVNKNLNRCFYKNNTGTTPEDVRARQLMKVLDVSDALLDLHMFYDVNGSPFAICEQNALDLASKFDVDIISTNWALTEPGATDGYMYLMGKIAVCVECGPILAANKYVDFAKKTIYQYLKYFDMTSMQVGYSLKNKRIIQAQKVVYKSTKDFKLAKGFNNFDKLSAKQIIASDKVKNYLAGNGDCIIFPHYGAVVGEEAYILGSEMQNVNSKTTV